MTPELEMYNEGDKHEPYLLLNICSIVILPDSRASMVLLCTLDTKWFCIKLHATSTAKIEVSLEVTLAWS